MSDTTKLILWVILALVVIAIIILLVRAGSRRRQEEARRREATSLRAQARAAAERARGHEDEAGRRSARAAELAEEAKTQKTAAATQHARQDALVQRADRIDPDVSEPAQGRSGRQQDGRPQGAQSQGAQSRLAQSQEAQPEGAQSQGARPQGAEPRGAGPEGGRSDGAQSQGVRPDGARRSGPAGPEPRRAQPQPTQQAGPGPRGGQPSEVQPARGQRPAPSIGLGLGAPDFEDDEPDLADAANPFGTAAAPAAASRGRDGGRGRDDRGDVSGRDGGHLSFDGVSAADRDDVVRDADAGAGDTRGPGPDEHALTTPAADSGGVSPEPAGSQDASDSTDRDTTPEKSEGDTPLDPAPGNARDDAAKFEDDDPAPGDAQDDDDPQSDADWVNGPVEEAVPLEEVQAEAEDAADWINGPEEAEPVTIEVPERAASQSDRHGPAGGQSAEQGQAAPVPDTGASDPAAPSVPTDQVLAHVPEQPHGAPAEGEKGTVPDNEGDPVNSRDLEDGERYAEEDADVAGQGDRFDESGASGQRLVSRLDEVVDGGHGVGSAAPIPDGAQPLGHPIKAWRDTMTYVLPGGLGYQGGKPDVWFQSEQAAQAAGYRRGGV